MNLLNAFWTVHADGRVSELVTASTPGHTVDTSEIQNGTLCLEVNNTNYSEGNSYDCTAVNSNRATEESEVFPVPKVES